MFSSLSAFLWFFIPTLILIVLGIAFEKKLVRFERKLCAILKAVWKTVLECIAERRKTKAIAVAYQIYRCARKANDIQF